MQHSMQCEDLCGACVVNDAKLLQPYMIIYLEMEWVDL